MATLTWCACLALYAAGACGFAAAFVFFIETVSAQFASAAPAPPAPRPSFAVLVPAHDEELGIGRSLATIFPELEEHDRLLVVADNCRDETARVAREAGAEVIERSSVDRRGKGFALDFGVRHLAESPPQVVIIVDADCTIEPGALQILARTCLARRRPIQALYLMNAVPNAGLKARIAAFAWIVKNQVRPLGARALGMPCQLMGTGMAFPWQLIESAPLASGHLVEDMELGAELASRGTAPFFCAEARVDSVFPERGEGVASQRKRWEQGHLAMIATRVPALLAKAAWKRRPGALALAIDLLVPPLALLVLLLGTLAAAGGALALLTGNWLPLSLIAVDLSLVLLGVISAWARFGRRVLSLRELAGAPLYAAAKVPMYLRLMGRRQMEWVRTKRS